MLVNVVQLNIGFFFMLLLSPYRCALSDINKGNEFAAVLFENVNVSVWMDKLQQCHVRSVSVLHPFYFEITGNETF